MVPEFKILFMIMEMGLAEVQTGKLDTYLSKIAKLISFSL